MAILGGFTAEFTLIVSVRMFFGILIRSFFVGVLAFLVGLSVRGPWYIKIALAGLFGFIGIPSILLIVKRMLSAILNMIQNVTEVFDKAQEKSEKNASRKKNGQPKGDGSKVQPTDDDTTGSQ